MSKLSNAILLLKILESGKVYKIKELSEMIECSPRAIRGYKDDLEKAGIYINSIYGKYGGYVYTQEYKIGQYTFDKTELRTLEDIYIKISDSSVVEKKEIQRLSTIIDKIRYFALLDNLEKSSKTDKDVIDNYYNEICHAILEKRMIKFYYNRDRNSKIYRTLIPQNIYVYNKKYFVTGVVKEINQIRTFAIETIKDLKII